jgi:probable F420-dependent oxidoreductase
MRLGAIFPQLESGTDPIAIRDYAQAVEGLGYDDLTTFDHVLGADPNRPEGFRGPYTHESLFHEPLVLFGYLAGVTERLELVTGILILPQRQTALVAKQAAEVDVLSGGRLRLGVAGGWNAVEYAGLGEDFHVRGRRIEEQIAPLRALWAKPVVNFDGRFDHVALAGINPRPVRGTIPLWLGGGADAVVERVGRLADGWFPQVREPSQLGEAITRVAEIAQTAGRDASAIGYEVALSASRGATGAQAREFEAAGATHVSLNTMDAGFGSLGQHLDALRAFLEQYRNAG